MRVAAQQALDLTLASRSPVRRRLLKAAGLRFDIAPAALDETALLTELEMVRPALSFEARATALARAKAKAVSARLPDQIVIGADQILEFEGEAYEAPDGRAEAAARLKALRGKSHRLISGVAVVRAGEVLGAEAQGVSVVMRAFDDQELQAYLDQAGEEVFGTVGAYALEELGARLVERIDGDWFAALGLPLWPLLRMLEPLEEAARAAARR
ncbi:MAG: nucleoside triphosphate pyrophosphatase [Pseudomonadota bacterium]